MRTRWTRTALVAAVLAAAVGCAAAPPPGEVVPSLRAQLSRVDTALADRQYGTARTALDALVRETIAARDAGKITADQANLILAAADRLAADLPDRATPTSAPPPTAAPAPTGQGEQTPTSEPGREDKDQKGEGKKDEEKEDGEGDSNTSENSPTTVPATTSPVLPPVGSG